MEQSQCTSIHPVIPNVAVGIDKVLDMLQAPSTNV